MLIALLCFMIGWACARGADSRTSTGMAIFHFASVLVLLALAFLLETYGPPELR